MTAKLVEAETGFQRWSNNFEGTLTDVFSFQDRIAGGVAAALGEFVGQGGLQGQAVGLMPTANPETYDRYLLARQLWRVRQEEPIRRAIGLLERVVADEPDFAPGWSALASAYLTLGAYARDPGDAWQRSRRAAQAALTLDEREAEAQAVLASHAQSERNWVQAAERFQRARELAPSNPTVRLWFAELLAKTGHVSRGLEELSVALEVDPLYTPALGNAGHQLASLGRLDEAAQSFQQSWDLGLDAMFVWFGAFYVAVMQERFEDAQAWLDRRPMPLGIEVDRALLDARREPTEENRMRLAGVTLENLDRGLRLREALLYLAVAGDFDTAFDLALSAAEQGWTQTESLWNPWLSPLRHDPRFAELVRALQLEAFWIRYGPPDGCALTDGLVDCGP